MIKTTQRKRNILIAELRAALKTIPKCSDSEILSYCNLTSETLDEDIAFLAVPWVALRFDYHMRGVRALRARQGRQILNGASFRQRATATHKTAGKGGLIV